jgi:hypothetical protein
MRNQWLISLGIVFSLLSTGSPAIEFVNNTVDANWTKMEEIGSGCVAFRGADYPEYVWVGQCSGALPHGKGFSIKRGSVVSAAMNQGREYRSGFPPEPEDQAMYFERASYIGAYATVFYAQDDTTRIVGPAESTVLTAADRFLGQFSSRATAEDLAKIKRLRSESEAALMETGYQIASHSNSPATIQEYLTKWDKRISSERQKLLTQRKVGIEKQQAEAAEARARQERLAAIEREKVRERMRKTACSLFYPGYVGRYKGDGLFATSDSFVVRYVNPSASTVTIEGTDSGNTLKYGQYVEISCFYLWEGLK